MDRERRDEDTRVEELDHCPSAEAAPPLRMRCCGRRDASLAASAVRGWEGGELYDREDEVERQQRERDDDKRHLLGHVISREGEVPEVHLCPHLAGLGELEENLEDAEEVLRLRGT